MGLTHRTDNFSGFIPTLQKQGSVIRQEIYFFGRIVRVDEPDLTGNLGAVTAPVQPTNYEYDGNDNLKKVTQTLGGTTQERVFDYDALSRLRHERQVEATATLDSNGVKQTSGGLWTGAYKYTADGLLDYGVDARGVKTTFAYDGLNRVETVTYTGETGYQTPQVTYTYSEAESVFFNVGRLTKVKTAANTTYGTPETIQNYDYDSVGQIKKHSQSIGDQVYNLEYGYNLAGQLVSEKYPSGKIVNMTVDNFGVTQSIGDAQRTYLNGVTFDNRGVLSQINFGNGTSETYSHNDRFQMESQSLNKGSEVLQKYDYKYGKINSTDGTVDITKNNGQLARIESFIGANKQSQQRFEYDSIGRLEQSSEHRGETNALTYKQKFDFDRFGNLYRKVASNPTAGQANPLPYTPIEETDISKSTNQFTTGTTYNEAGQVITDNKFRGGMNFAYDAIGRNIKVSQTNVPDAWTVYDALGNRVATKINEVWQYLIYDAYGKLVAEYGAGSEGTGGVKYIQQDWQGSVRAVTNNGGFVVSRTDHQAFGDEVGAGVGMRTTGQGYSSGKVSRQGYGLTENDQGSGQQHTWFRKLETQAGRWSSPDPYKGSMSVGNPQSFNRYSYVENQPTNFVDPSGLACRTVGYWTGVDGDFSFDSYRSYCTVDEFRWRGYEPPDRPIREPHEPDTPPPNETCTLEVNISAVATSSSSSTSRSGSGSSGGGSGGVGIINHLYITLTDSAQGLTGGVRAGPSQRGITGSGYVQGTYGPYDENFQDFETNRSTAVREVYDGTCDALANKFQEYIRKLNTQRVPYQNRTTNSNAFVSSILNYAGINAGSFTERLNKALGWGYAPGWGTTLPVN